MENRLVRQVGGMREGQECHFIKKDTRKSHFSQCINLRNKGKKDGGKKEGVEEIQSGIK